MARIRTIKPEFFRHVGMFEAEGETGLPLRIAYIGLWTSADREGRFKWEPRALKLDCLPYDDVDFSAILDALHERGFIVRYEVDGRHYGAIPSWLQHQHINQREAQSNMPAPTGENTCAHVHARAVASHIPNGVNLPGPLRETVLARDGHMCLRCKATDDLTVDHIFPQSIGGTHAAANLRTLCRACNSRRPVAGEALIQDLAIDGLTLADMPRMCMHVQDRGEGKGKEGEGKGTDIGTRRERVREPDAFDDFKKAYPRREGANPWPPARKLYLAALKAGATPEEILHGVRRLAERERKNVGTPYIPQAVKWLRNRGWEELDDTATEGRDAIAITPQSPNWAPWRAHYVATGRSYAVSEMDRIAATCGSWTVPSALPPEASDVH
jgi:hypothetical protein